MKALTDEWKRPQDGDLSRDDLIVKYLPLVKYVLGKLSVRLPPHLDGEDLIGAGITGLIHAAGNFDPSRLVKFSTYAVPRIRGAMLDELRSHDWVPRSARQKASTIEATQDKLRDRWGRDPTIDEIANELNVDPEQVERLLADVQFASVRSLDTIFSDDQHDTGGSGHSFGDRSLTDPADACESEEQRALLSDAIAQLPERQRVVVTLYYFEDLLLKEIGEILGISESRVSQLRGKAVATLQSILALLMPVQP